MAKTSRNDLFMEKGDAFRKNVHKKDFATDTEQALAGRTDTLVETKTTKGDAKDSSSTMEEGSNSRFYDIYISGLASF